MIGVTIYYHHVLKTVMSNSLLSPRNLPKNGKLVIFTGPCEEFEVRSFPIDYPLNNSI
jgi:hypothetical protein